MALDKEWPKSLPGLKRFCRLCFVEYNPSWAGCTIDCWEKKEGRMRVQSVNYKLVDDVNGLCFQQENLICHAQQ